MLLQPQIQFDKPNGIQAYHGYLSFKEDEVTPELAQQIGMEFANEVWGKRFQVVVTTHLNTKHLHCHFVVNSVSFVDGKKIANEEKAWFKFSQIADRLCREHGLSVIENPDRNRPSYHITRQTEAGMPTRFSVAKAAVDEAISRSRSLVDFERELQKMGYSYDLSKNRTYWTIKPAWTEKSMRMYRFGDDYTNEKIKERIRANRDNVASLTSTDELDLATLGDKKVALFAIIPDNDSSFNFLVSILYTQLFQQLFYSADHLHGGSLPVPVHFLMDEFANVSLPDDFDKILSVMRSRGVSVSIILQNLAQLKALFDKQWESIIGNCDEFLYLGGNEQSTHKYVSELLGKETIDTNTYGKSSGRSGNYSTNYQISGRELLTPDEVRMLDNQYAILFIRGERPILDFKYDILKHPSVALTADGKAEPYKHGEVRTDVATIEIESLQTLPVPDSEYTETNWELLSDEDFEEPKHY